MEQRAREMGKTSEAAVYRKYINQMKQKTKEKNEGATMKSFNDYLMEGKNKPTDPKKWAAAKAQARAKFDVYPSAYANAWASKKYKAMGGDGEKSLLRRIVVVMSKRKLPHGPAKQVKIERVVSTQRVVDHMSERIPAVTLKHPCLLRLPRKS